jgi:uncharacterized protein Yka (UPF0111/DUF47 family)
MFPLSDQETFERVERELDAVDEALDKVLLDLARHAKRRPPSAYPEIENAVTRLDDLANKAGDAATRLRGGKEP